MIRRKRLTQVFPMLTPIRQKQKQICFRLGMMLDRNKYATFIADKKLPLKITQHKSLLFRKLGDSDMNLQRNKVVNLQLASKKFSGVQIRPGEVFSFWHMVGDVTYAKGYQDGILLSDGEVKVGCGGGLCQLANLLFWMFLHTPLDVIERYRHSFDPFPDYGRVIPFGTGATLVNGWKDIKMKNNTPHTFQIDVSFDEKYILGEISADEYPRYTYHIREKNHRFVKKADGIYRQNEIYREVTDRKTGILIEEQFLFRNDCMIKYQIDETFIHVEQV